MKRIAPFHGLTLLFLIGLILLTLYFRDQVPLWRSLLFRYLLWIGLLVAIKLSSERSRMARMSSFFHDFSPILFIVLIYESLGDLIQHLQPDIDPILIQIDLFLFGVHPTVWIEQWIVPWFTDVMSFTYVSYYFLPVILVVVLSLKNQKQELYLSLFTLTLGYYLSFIGYIFFPAIGPRYTLIPLQSIPLEGSLLTDLVRDGLNAIEHNKRDCMPSGHTQIALMVLFLAYRYQRVLFYSFLPFVCGLILSTVYLRYHYVIDLIAGASMAVGCVLIGPSLYKFWKWDDPT
jgi:membrane-associated phospholipid phosphatase